MYYTEPFLLKSGIWKDKQVSIYPESFCNSCEISENRNSRGRKS